MLRATDPRGYAASIRAIGFVNLIPRLGAIRSPTLVIVGEKDPGTPPAMAEVLHEKIPGARLVDPARRHALLGGGGGGRLQPRGGRVSRGGVATTFGWHLLDTGGGPS